MPSSLLGSTFALGNEGWDRVWAVEWDFDDDHRFSTICLSRLSTLFRSLRQLLDRSSRQVQMSVIVKTMCSLFRSPKEDIGCILL